MENNQGMGDRGKTSLINKPFVRVFVDHYASFVKRHPMICVAALLAFIVLLFIEEERQAIFDAGKELLLIAGAICVFAAIALGLSKIFNPKIAALIAVSIFVAAFIGVFAFIVMCWGGGC